MSRQLAKKIGSFMVGAILLLGLATPSMGDSGYSLGVKTTSFWDIASDKGNNVYIMWFYQGTMYAGKILNRAITAQKTVTSKANNNKYCVPRLSVRGDGKTASIIYISVDQRSLMHAWLDENGSWQNETVYRSASSKVYYPAGAVDLDGTIHAAFTKSGTIRYLYKKPGMKWTHDKDIDVRNSEGTRIVVDSQGGIHCTWMPYTSYLSYRYAVSGQTIDKSSTELIVVNDSEESGVNQNLFSKNDIIPQTMARERLIRPASEGLIIIGIGDLFVTKSGIVHQTLVFGRKIWHTSKVVGGRFSTPTSVFSEKADSELEINPAIGADENGKVFIAWAEGSEDMVKNSVKLATFENNKWKVKTLAARALVNGINKPSMTVTGKAVYILWKQRDDNMYLHLMPMIPVSSAINVGVEQFYESSFFNSYHFNHVTWEDDPFNIENSVNIDHYNIYRKAKSAKKYDESSPIATGIPASTHSYDDVSTAVNTAELNFDYYVTTVALIDGKLVESPIFY